MLEFGRWISSQCWSDLFDAPTVDNKVELFMSKLSGAVRQSFPTRQVRTASNDKPWFNKKLKLLKSQRDQEFRRRGKTSRYKKLRNKLQRQIRKSKCKYIQNRLEECDTGSNGFSWYNQIKSICGIAKRNFTLNTPTATSDLDTATLINQFFSEICTSLAKLDVEAIGCFLPAPRPPIIQAHEVYSLLSTVQLRKSQHPNDIPAKIIKRFAAELATPLTHIFNESLHAGEFPTPWKHAAVTPVPKVQPPGTVNNRRPISLTPTFSKILETFVSNWVQDDIENSVDRHQYGNIPRTSTVHYLVSLIDMVTRELEKPRSAVQLALIDFSKAFDRIARGQGRHECKKECCFLHSSTPRTTRHRAGIRSSHRTLAGFPDSEARAVKRPRNQNFSSLENKDLAIIP